MELLQLMRGDFYFHLRRGLTSTPQIKPIKLVRQMLYKTDVFLSIFRKNTKRKINEKYTQIISILCRMNKSYAHKASFLIQPFRTQKTNTVSTTETSFTVEAKRSKDSWKASLLVVANSS